MPELPEVEAARRAIQENCVGKRIVKSIVADDSKVIDAVSAADFQASLAGKTIVAAHRKGKNLWLELDSPPFPSFQFGMAGAVYIKGVAVTKYVRSAVKDDEEWPSKYSKVFIELNDGLEFSFTDKRRFAKVRLLKDPTCVPPISELGPDALMEPKSAEEFVASLSKKKIAIKTLLLDQSFISGIGNWIADEVLYQAKIHPLQVASSLTKESCATLQKCIKEVIEKAVKVGADSSQFPNNWIFHNREKKPGKAFADGKKIEFITAGGRTTAFVPELQKLSGDQATKVSAKQKKGTQDNSDEDEVKTDDGENTKPKKRVNPRVQVKKKLPPKRKSKESDNEGDDESDSEAESTKPKKGSKVKRRQVKKKLPAKRKSKESDDDGDESDDDDESESEDENSKPKKALKPKVGQAKKKLPVKGNDDDITDDDDDDDDDDDEDGKIQTKRSKTVADRKGTKKTAQSGQNSKNLRKKAK